MRRRLIFVGWLFGLAGPGLAYDQPVHELLSRSEYRGPVALSESADAIDLLRSRIYHAGAESSDADLRARFVARYPTEAVFDAWELKHLFALDPSREVAGFDHVPLPSGPGADAYALASRLPDDDQRNCNRFRRDSHRRIVLDPFGRPLPEDPATLEMGALTGLSSQAHAHYGLPHLAFSDDPEVLKTDPRRFAVPPTVHTFTAQFAGSYTALAVLAWRLPGGERLSVTMAGAAAHHLEDAANQIHAVQVGLYDFFVDAKIQSILEELRSVGGLVRPRQGFVSIGIDIITNHHLLAERLYAKRLLAQDPEAAPTAPDDSELAKVLERLPEGCGADFAEAITSGIIDRSSFEGPEVYQEIRNAALPRYSRVGTRFREDDDPDSALRPGARLDRFMALEVAGATRARQGLRAWWSRFQACLDLGAKEENSIAEGLLRKRLDALEASETRARAYLPPPPEARAIDYWVAGGYLLLLGLALAAIALSLRRKGTRSPPLGR